MGSFVKALEGFRKKVERRADEFVLRVMLELRTRLIIRSPVDKGRFRGAWIYGLDAQPTGEPGGLDPSGSKAAARIAASIPVQAAGHVHWLANNTPYSVILERGGSNQAPQGVVGPTVIEFDQVVQRVRDAMKS